jgi:uncharacterized protein YukE
MSDSGSGKLFVNPEGVSSVGREYGVQADKIRLHAREIQNVRDQYAGCWGNDQLGKQFEEKFVNGLNALEGIVTRVADTLDRTAKDLDDTGKDFRRADDDAGDAACQLAKGLDNAHDKRGRGGEGTGSEKTPLPKEDIALTKDGRGN